MYWGSLSDRVGRKPILLLGCICTSLSLLVVGFAPSLWVALLGRLLGGAFNGNIGIIQTMVGELCKKKEHEPKAYSVMPFVWSIGTIVGPCVGGYFANPEKSFPRIFAPDNIFTRYPYALPNVICAILMLVSVVVGYFFLEETHPDLQPWSTKADLATTSAETPLMPTAGATAHAAADLTHASYGTFDTVDLQPNSNWPTPSGSRKSSPTRLDSKPSILRCKRVVMLVVALGIFTTHTMGYDVLLPIFAQDARSPSLGLAGGLGLTTQQVGAVMAVNGVIALFTQAVVFPLLASWMGVWRLFLVVTIGHPLAYIAVPYISCFAPGSTGFYTALYGCLTVRNIFSIVAYPLLLILIKEASPAPSCLGRINGLAASTGAACRMVASPLVGYLYGMGARWGCSGLSWWVCGLIALMGVVQLPWMRRNKEMRATVRGAARCRFIPEENRGARDGSGRKVVRIVVEEVDGYESEEV